MLENYTEEYNNHFELVRSKVNEHMNFQLFLQELSNKEENKIFKHHTTPFP